MKVLSIASSLDPARGGTQAGATNMVLATQRAGVHNVLVAAGTPAARRRAHAFTAPLREEGVRVKQFASLPWPPEHPDRWGLSVPQMGWVARNVEEFDLVHIHGVWGLALLSGLAAARLRGTRVVVTAHESFTAFDVDDSRSIVRRRQKLVLKEAYLRWAHLFVLTSQLEAEDSVPSLDQGRVRVVPYPLVDANGAIPPLKRPSGGDLVVGFLGRIHPKKNLDLLIEAIHSLPGHIRLVVAGDGPAAHETRKLASARGIDDRVTWLGFVPPERRAEFFDGVDVVVMPSTFESFGMSAAEAMLHGVPVIVSRRTGISELIQRHGGGLIVTPDVPAVAGAIRRLEARGEAMAELGEQAQAAVRAELTYSRVGDALVDAYDHAMEISA
jgi:glycosyltransferase involved in cell wall biosynthesis